MLWKEINEEVRKSGGVIQPSAGDVHVNVPLTNISVAFMQDASAYVAARIFPNIPVMKQSDLYFEYDREAWLRSHMEERADGTESAGATYMIESDTYFAKVYALHDDVTDRVRVNADNPLSPDQDATMFLSGQALLQKETKFATEFLKDGVWTLSVDGAAARAATDLSADGSNNVVYWSSADSTPIEDIRLMKREIQMRTGFRPNVLVISRPIYDVLVEHPDIIDRLNRGQTSGAAQANMDDLKRLFELEDLVVMDAIQNTSALGVAASYKFIGDKDGLLLYRPAAPGLRVPSAGYTFSWRGYIGASSEGARISRFRMENLKADRIEIECAYTFKRISADLGCFIDGIIQ